MGPRVRIGGQTFLLRELELLPLTVKLLCLQSLKALMRMCTFPLVYAKETPIVSKEAKGLAGVGWQSSNCKPKHS